MSKYTSLDLILGKEEADLTAVNLGEYSTTKLGLLPYTAVDHKEYKAAKKDCLKMVPDGTGGMVPELDDDKLMVKVILTAVDKDKRSDFTFYNKGLLNKLNVVSADDAVGILLSPGEIYNIAMDIQEISGFGKKANKKLQEEVKNS